MKKCYLTHCFDLVARSRSAQHNVGLRALSCTQRASGENKRKTNDIHRRAQRTTTRDHSESTETGPGYYRPASTALRERVMTSRHRVSGLRDPFTGARPVTYRLPIVLPVSPAPRHPGTTTCTRWAPHTARRHPFPLTQPIAPAAERGIPQASVHSSLMRLDLERSERGIDTHRVEV